MDSSHAQKNYHDHGKWIKIEDVHTIMASVSSYKNILFSDGKTKLLDCITSMEKPSTLQIFVKNIVDINTVLPSDSPLWPGCTPLHLAVMFSDNIMNENEAVTIVKQFLDQDASVQVQDQLGTTPLHLAFRLELQLIVALLLRSLEKNVKGVANLLDSEHLSYLHIFCTTSDHRNGLARALLSDKRKIECTMNVAYKGNALANVKPGWTPLHVAAHQSQLYLVELLLQQGADLLCTDARGYTAIHPLFGSVGTKPLADILFASKQLRESRVEDVGLTHLHVAVWFNDAGSVERLLDSGANIEASVESLEDEHLKKFTRRTPLQMALQLNHLRTVKVLLQRGADVLVKNDNGTSPLANALTGWQVFSSAFVSSIWSDEKRQKRLEEELGLTMLHLACFYKCDLRKVKEELEKGADVNAKIHDNSNFWMGYTPLHVLVATRDSGYSRNESDVLAILMKNNCDIDQQDSAGKTAFHWAMRVDHFPPAYFLLAAGTDINIVDRSGKSALSYALKCRSLCEDRYDLDRANSLILDLVLHLYKMQLAGIEVSALNETLRNTTLRKVKVPSDLCNENAFYDRVQATENVRIGKRGLTLRSFLRETHAVSMYPSLTRADRLEVAAFFQSFDYQSHRDLNSLLRLQYRKAVARLSLIDPARDALRTFICSGFPDLCVDMILKYLSNLQIKNLIAASFDDCET